jgi:hypothetical protein
MHKFILGRILKQVNKLLSKGYSFYKENKEENRRLDK